MAFKRFELDEHVSVTVYKRRANRHLRLSVTSRGEIRVSIPTWAPYKVGVEFARSRMDWIRRQQKPVSTLVHGQAIGKAHHLEFVAADKLRPSSRIKGSIMEIQYPRLMKPEDQEVQLVASRAALRALRQQAESLLPQRLARLASQHDFTYQTVSIKKLHGRWGSCDQYQNIVFNLYLMQLPWDLIDYVILHELVHTKVLKHGPDFWAAMQVVSPEVKALRKRIRDFQPVLDGSIIAAVA